LKKVLSSAFRSTTLRNSFWSTFEVLALPVLMLLVTPYFLRKMGAEVYGQWVLINSIIASLGVLNMGLGDAAIRFIARYKNVDRQRTIRIANTAYSFYLGLSVAGLLIAYSYLFLEKQFPLFFDERKNIFLSLLQVGVLLFGIRLIEQIVFSIYKGFERFDLFSKFSITSKTVLVLTNIVIVALGYSLFTILMFTVVTSFIFLLIEFLFLQKFLPGFSAIPKIDKSVFSEIIGFGVWSWIQTIIGILNYQLDKFVVAYLAGVTVLAYYSIGFTIGSQIFNVYVAFANWVFPKVSQIDDKERLRQLYMKAQFLIVVLSVVSISVFYLVKEPVLTLWLGDDIYNRSLIYINAYLIYSISTIVTIVPTFFTMGVGNMKLVTAVAFVSMLLTVTLMYFMFNAFDSLGIVYGRVLSGFLIIPIFIALFRPIVLRQPVNIYTLIEVLIPLLFSILIFFDNAAAIGIALVVFIPAVYYYIKRHPEFLSILKSTSGVRD
jgi:O-antigen/teichoic acid export membrane protein